MVGYLKVPPRLKPMTKEFLKRAVRPRLSKLVGGGLLGSLLEKSAGKLLSNL